LASAHDAKSAGRPHAAFPRVQSGCAPVAPPQITHSLPRRALEQTVELATSVGLIANQALRLVWLGEALLLAGRREGALETARRALHLAEERRERGQAAYARRLLAELIAGGTTPDLATADATFREALVAANALEMRPLAGQCCLGLGRLHRRIGKPEVAAAQLREAAATFEATGMARGLTDARAELDQLG
jgi:tetratricopeptide (TPR) repeat protein